MNKEYVKKIVLESFRNALVRQELEVPEQFDFDIVLLASGVDSLGFAVMVASLEDELGYDPFTLMDTPVYPKNLGEFVSIYLEYSEHLKTQ